jgi:ATP-grasp ribosomal peptide maturase
MSVLVLTRFAVDPVADLVIAELNRRSVPVVRFDTGAFPADVVVSSRLDPDSGSWRGVWRGKYRALDLSEVRAVYYRRPGPFRLGNDQDPGAGKWAEGEARAGLGGVLCSLNSTWVNHPWNNARANFSPYALAEGARAGLRIPDTLITSDPDEARDFIAALPGRVAAYKAIGTAPAERDGEPVAVWTSTVRPEDITDAVRLTAHQFQEWIDKKYEVRLTAVQGLMFAAEIHAGSEASRVDFRRDYPSLTYRPCDTPEPIARGVVRLMESLGLRYCALDFLVSHDGRWHLVDINPTGQFGFIPELQAPITTALADVLEGKTR